MNPKLIKYLENEKITSLLNSTKWNRLFTELESLGVYLKFQRKDLLDSHNLYWVSDIYHVFGGVEVIEWLTISGIEEIPQGQLLSPKLIDNSEAVERAICKAGLPYTYQGTDFRVWGYLRLGSSPQWAST